MAGTTTNVDNWYYDQNYVEYSPDGSEFINSETTLIAFGPGNFGDSWQKLYPGGKIEALGINQGKQLQRMFEIGSSLSFFVPGRVIGGFNLARVLLSKASLLRIAYKGVSDAIPPIGGPGIGDEFWINLAADIFAKPFGMAILMKDRTKAKYGGFYLEGCHFNGHSFSLQAGAAVLVESAAGEYTRLIPIDYQKKGRTSSELLTKAGSPVEGLVGGTGVPQLPSGGLSGLLNGAQLA